MSDISNGVLRLATRSDIASVAGLYHRVWHESHGASMPEAERALRDELSFVTRATALMPHVAVRTVGETLQGFAAWSGSLLGQLFVDANHRGGIVAQALIEFAEQRMRAQGVMEAELHCMVGNDRARRFYERTGWALRGTTDEMVAGSSGSETLTFWVMRKDLSQAQKPEAKTRGR
jgi:GNAT superfamily N-acetyltransferase